MDIDYQKVHVILTLMSQHYKPVILSFRIESNPNFKKSAKAYIKLNLDRQVTKPIRV